MRIKHKYRRERVLCNRRKSLQLLSNKRSKIAYYNKRKRIQRFRAKWVKQCVDYLCGISKGTKNYPLSDMAIAAGFALAAQKEIEQNKQVKDDIDKKTS